MSRIFIFNFNYNFGNDIKVSYLSECISRVEHNGMLKTWNYFDPR